MKTYPQIKEEIIQSFIDKYERFELCERVCKPDYDKLKSFLSSSLDSLVKQTLEAVGVKKVDTDNEDYPKYCCCDGECFGACQQSKDYGYNSAIYQFNQKKEEFIKEKI
jgi:hypothetical protein